MDKASSTTEGVNQATRQSRPFASVVRRVLHEPLVHFILIGAALFIAYGLLTPPTSRPNGTRIELTPDDLEQLRLTWMAQWQRLPTEGELRGLIETKVRQEILYREALALGLDEGDEIVKRRMAQKMDFLNEDVSALREPEAEELKAWFEKHSARFALSSRMTFRHLYFSPDIRGPQARQDAEHLLQQLKATDPSQANDPELAKRFADRFMDQDYYVDCSPEQAGKIFGARFSESIFKANAGEWLGPFDSGLGWHLVWIESITPSRVPAFDEVDPSELKSEWMTDQRAETKQRAFAAIRDRYEIVLPK